MPVIPVTLDNVEHLKAVMRLAIPEVGSSHRAEALSALLGYRTHATLLAALPTRSECPAIVQPNLIQLAKRLHDLRHSTRDLSRIEAALASSDIPTPAWQEFKQGDLNGMNRWFRSCELRSVPYVYITTSRKFARVDWDWITVGSSEVIERLERLGIRYVIDKMFAIFREHAAPAKALFEGSAFVGGVEQLTFESARALADEFALFLNKTQRGLVHVEA